MLIIGASGVVGRSLAKNCLSHFEVTGTYFNHNYNPDFIKLRKLDLTQYRDIEECLDEVQPYVVVHSAGMTDVQQCQENTEAAEEVNFRATAQLAAFCKEKGIRLVYLSSDQVFDGEKGNYNEDEEPSPKNHYGKTKYDAEKAVKSICENYVIARLNLIYGHGEAVKKTFTDRILIANWAQKTYPIFAGQVRSPLSLDVASRAIRELADSEFIGTLNLGGLEAIDRWDFALKLIAFLKIDPSVIEKAQPDDKIKELYPINTSYDTSKAQQEIKTELLSIDEGLKLEYSKYMD